MNKNAKKMYVAPSIKEHVVELEQGIAAGSQGAQPSSPNVSDYSEQSGSQGFDTDQF